MMNQTRLTNFYRARLVRVQAALLTLALAAAPLSVSAQGFNIFSPQQDVQIGQQSAAQANRQLPLLNDSRAARVNRIGRRLAAVAPGPRFPYQFRVVNDSRVNAFALPGGFIYINKGAIDTAGSDDEIAAILAHEIAHAGLRHGTNQVSKAYAAQAGLSLLGGFLGGRANSNVGQIIGAVGGFGLNTLFMKFSRSAEEQADSIGMQMMRRAGYNPYGMVRMLQTIQRTTGRSGPEWMSSHPNQANRIARLQRQLGAAPGRR
jgi:beta-barrel assembly-enhancing protease